LDYRIPDNAGNQPKDLPIREGGPAAYFSTLPVGKIITAIKESGIPAEQSLTAGSYLCNHMMYTLLDLAAEDQTLKSCGFIHIPVLPEQVSVMQKPMPSMSLEILSQGIEIAIQTTADHLISDRNE
jgi:pyroglutamyl-peptidase